EKNHFAQASQIVRATGPDAPQSANSRTQSASRPASRDRPGAQACPILQSRKEKIGADTSAARNARSRWTRSRQARARVLRFSRQLDTRQGPSAIQQPAS